MNRFFQLLGEWQPGDLARLKTDVFRERVRFSEDLKRRIARARGRGKDGLGDLGEIENDPETTLRSGDVADLEAERCANPA